MIELLLLMGLGLTGLGVWGRMTISCEALQHAGREEKRA